MLNKMSNLNTLSALRIFVYCVALVLCFFIFKQNDLTITYTSSYAYLQGHFLDFYDYNQPIVDRNDYLPLTYILFAIWNIPLKVLGLLTPTDMGVGVWLKSSPVEILWSKLLIVCIFFACVFLLEKISTLIAPKLTNTPLRPSVLFATSPIAIFAIFIFSQYDIFGVFFTLLGLYYYFKMRFLTFALLFSFAISFKYFAVLVYIPLLFIIEKRPLHLVKFLLIGILITALQILVYWHSEVFQLSFFYLAGGKSSDAMHRGKAIYIAFLYTLLCGYAYFGKLQLSLEKSSWAITTILISTLAYGLMFALVQWHPQWLIILMPFFYLATLTLRRLKYWLILETIAYICFLWICFKIWPKNVDVTMAQAGIFGGFFHAFSYFGSDLLSPKLEGLARVFFFSYLFSPFGFFVYENWPLVRMKLNQLKCKILGKTDSKEDKVLTRHLLALPLYQTELTENQTTFAFSLRLMVGGYFFLSITFVCLLLTLRANA